jgi:hypothetical protein
MIELQGPEFALTNENEDDERRYRAKLNVEDRAAGGGQRPRQQAYVPVPHPPYVDTTY